MKLIIDCSFPARMRVHAVDYILKPSKAMRSLFRQVDEQASDSDIPATTCPVTAADESLAEGSTSRRQSLFVPQEDSEMMKAPV